MNLTQHMEIDNSFDSAIKTGSRKRATAEFYQKLMKKVEWKELLAEAYLIAPVEDIKNDEEGITPYLQCGCRYPHHAFHNDKLILSVPRLKSIFVQAVETGDYFRNETLKHHLERHMEEMGIVDFREVVASSFDGVYEFVLKMLTRLCSKTPEQKIAETADYLFERVRKERRTMDARRWLDSDASNPFKASLDEINFAIAEYIICDYFSGGIFWHRQFVLGTQLTEDEVIEIYCNLDEMGYDEVAESFKGYYLRILEGEI